MNLTATGGTAGSDTRGKSSEVGEALVKSSLSSRTEKDHHRRKQESVVDALSNSLRNAITNAIASSTKSSSTDAAEKRRRLLLGVDKTKEPALPSVSLQDTTRALSSSLDAIKQGSLTRILQSLLLIMRTASRLRKREVRALRLISPSALTFTGVQSSFHRLTYANA